MAKRRKKEAVTATFHYLIRQETLDNGEERTIGFTLDEFTALSQRLQSLMPMDLTDEEVKYMLRFKNVVPIEDTESVDKRTLFGVYRAAYWGHAYHNTHAGEITADSISLRPFYFVLYWSDSGRIYLGVQYLAQFGSYTGLKNTVIKFIADKTGITAHSFRLEAEAYRSVEPTEIQVQVSRQPSSIAAGNTFGQQAMVAFKRGRQGENFEREVKSKLVPFLGTSREKVQHAVAGVLRDSRLLDVNDEDIADCTIIGEFHGRPKRISMISEGSFPTPFGLHVGFQDNGHPERTSAKKAMLKLLSEQIIKTKENA